MQVGMIGLGRMEANLLPTAPFERCSSRGEAVGDCVLTAPGFQFGGHLETGAAQ